jgi:ABC-type sugar transport system ATPase subunit
MRPLLECKDVTLCINRSILLDNINLSINPGEFLLLIGENGAGKTTLINILCGVLTHKNYNGSIIFNGKELGFRSPADAIHSGIITLHQEINLYDNLSIADNLYYQFPNVRNLPAKDRIKTVNKFLSNHSFILDSSKLVSSLDNAQKRVLEILKIYLTNPKLLILDEPTAPLGVTYENIVQKLIMHFKDLGCAILMISHEFVPYIPFIDHAVIMRDAHVVADLDKDHFMNENLVKLTWGDLWLNRYPKINIPTGREILALEHVTSSDNAIQDISITLYEHEIIGIYGRVGSGKSILARVMAGSAPIREGSIYVDCLPTAFSSSEDGIKLGIAYITDQRLEEGLYPNQSALNNAFSLRSNNNYSYLIHHKTEQEKFIKYSDHLNMQIESKRSAQTLSGGEQQKLLLIKWLMSSSRIFLLDDPTQSLDIPSKIDIYNLCNNIVQQSNKAIVIFSSNLEELLGICNRTFFLRKGKFHGSVSYNNENEAKEWLNEA